MSNEQKAPKSEGTGKAPAIALQRFYFPDLDRSIEAESLEEATKIANQLLNKP
jgi:hypothetical protein